MIGSIFIFLLLYSRSTSPLYCALGQDSCIFMIIGRELLNGKVPYVDLYENKGPFLYFIQALPQAIWPGRYSIFILQLMLWFIQFKIIDKISWFLYKKKAPASTFLLFFLFVLFNYQEGNLAEEYNLFFIFITALCFIKITETDKYTFPGISMGISLAAVMLIRINDIVPIIVFILCSYISIWTRKKTLTSILAYTLSGFTGMGIIILPTILYYHSHDALSDMLKGYLFVNTQYVEGQGAFLSERIHLLFSPFGFFCLLILFCALLTAYIYSRKSEYPAVIKLALWLLPCLSVPALFVSGSGFLHYTYVLGILVVFSAIILQQETAMSVRRFISSRLHLPLFLAKLAGILLICLLNLVISKGISAPLTANNRLVPRESQYLLTVSELMSHIPESEKSSLYIINGFSANFYMETDTLPAYRYFLPLVYAEISPEIEEELIRYFRETPPQWTIISDWEEITNASKGISTLLQQQYQPVSTNTPYVSLYRLK